MRLADGITHKHTIVSFSKLQEDFTKIHGKFYNYDKVEYVNRKTNIKIICPIHGEFEQTPRSHIKGACCPKCADIVRAEHTTKRHVKNRITTEQWVEKVNAIHNSKYSYLKTVFTGTDSKVTITCLIHGDWNQVAYSHMKSHGCPKCANIFTNRQFISKAAIVHKNKYKYDKTKYKSHDEKVTIICPEHGEFQQEAHSHLRGCGCPRCADRGFKKHLPGILYYFKINHKGKEYYKIGITNNSINARYTKEELLTAEILYQEPFERGSEALFLEQLIINSNTNHKSKLNLLKTGNTELFSEDVFDYTKRKYYAIYKANTCQTQVFS